MRFSSWGTPWLGQIGLPSGGHSDERSGRTGRRSGRTIRSVWYELSTEKYRSRNRGCWRTGHKPDHPYCAHRRPERLRSSGSPSRETISIFCVVRVKDQKSWNIRGALPNPVSRKLTARRSSHQHPQALALKPPCPTLASYTWPMEQLPFFLRTF